MNRFLILILLVFAFAQHAIAGRATTESYFKYSRWCAGEIQTFTMSDEDMTCSTTLPGVMIVDTIMLPTYSYLDFINFLTNPSGSSQSSKGSSDNTKAPASSEKKKDQNEIPEERKPIEKNRLSLFATAADDSVLFLATGETTPLLLATFEQVERFFIVTDPNADKHQSYAKALIRLNEMLINHELNFL
jgi:hypothetical protein